MPRERPQPPPFEPEWLERSLDRYLAWGLVFMVAADRGLRRVPGARARPAQSRDRARRRRATRPSATQLFAANCASCHGKDATGGGSAPALNSQQFLKSTTDDQIFALVSGGVSGTEMPAWSLDFGGTFTDEQVRQVITYLRSLEPNAPSVPELAPGRESHAVGDLLTLERRKGNAVSVKD